nr:ATP-dependent DNA helicase RRM3-like [Ipomoea batatas]
MDTSAYVVVRGHQLDNRISLSLYAGVDVHEFDEIKEYQSARWVSPPEAAWRIYAFPISEIKPAVVHLQVHIQNNYQYINFHGNDRTPKSFDNIKTINGNQAVTFREAAENLGLLSGDHIVEKCLDEAVLYQMPSSYLCQPKKRRLEKLQLSITYKSRKWIALATASSGIATSILPGGRTAHSTFKIPIDGDDKYIGDGTEQLVGRDKIKIPSSFIIPCTNEDTSLDALFQSVYPDLMCFETDPYSLLRKAILTPKNEIADEINSILIDRFPR